MAGQSVAQKFRQTFAHVQSNFNFFPMHMARGIRKMQRTLKDVDCIIEVHDARVPMSGRNNKFEETVSVRPRLLLLNKVDLIDAKHVTSLTNKIKNGDPNIKDVLFSFCKSDADITIRHQLLPSIINIIKSSDRYHRIESTEYNVLIIGIPNVGKSTLINALRSIHLKRGGKATATGAKPGITKTILERIKISESPKVYVLDSPGILSPSIPDMDVAMKLTLCDTIQEKIFGFVHVADYLLFILNKYQHFDYVTHYDLPHAFDDVYELLTHLSMKNNLILKLKSFSGGYNYRPNFTRAAEIFLKDYRAGKLGKIILDDDMIEH